MAKKKVLYVSHGHPDFNPGGGEWAAWFLYQAMKESDEYEPFLLARVGDHRFRHPGSRILGHGPDDHVHLLNICNAEYDYFGEFPLVTSVFNTSIKDFLETLKPDLIHFQHTHHIGIETVRYAKSILPDVRIVYTLHEYMGICPHVGSMIKTDTGQLCYQASPSECLQCFPHRKLRDFFLRERHFRSNYAAVSKFISPSYFLKDRYTQWGLDPNKIIVLDNGRPPWPKRERPPRQPGQPFTAAFIGQIVFHKGVDVFLKAAQEYLRRLHRIQNSNSQQKVSVNDALTPQQQSLPDIRFAVYGKMGKLSDSLRNEVDLLFNSCAEVVTYHGPYNLSQIPDILNRVDCVVIPSKWWENSPLTVQESFMAHVPIVCSNVGGLAEKVTDGVNGLHFIINDPIDLTNRLVEMASSPELHSRLVSGIPEVITDREMADKIHDIYAEVFAEAQPA